MRVLDFESKRLSEETTLVQRPLPNEDLVPSLESLLSKEDPATIYVKEKKIGQGYENDSTGIDVLSRHL